METTTQTTVQVFDGVTVELLDQERKLFPVREDGYLGRLTTPERLMLCLRVSPGCNPVAVSVDGNRNVALKKNWTSDPLDGKSYRSKMAPRWHSNGGFFYTVHPENHVRLVQFPDYSLRGHPLESGEARMWEVAVISQGGEFFLTTQQTCVAEVYLDNNDRRVYPLFERDWPQMNEWLEEQLPENLEPAPIQFYDPSVDAFPRWRYDHLRPGEAVCEWFNYARGVGCLMLHNGLKARVHWTQLTDQRPLRRYLEREEFVRFEHVGPPAQTGDRTTEFEWEVTGVSLVR